MEVNVRVMSKGQGRWVAYMAIGGKRVTRYLGATKEEAQARLNELRASGLIDIFFPPRARPEAFYPDIPRLVGRARGAARESGREFDLTNDDVRAMLGAQEGRCAISGITFDSSHRVASSGRRPFAASIDRIDCARGYTRDNVRLVCAIVNLALGDWGEDTLRRVAIAIAMKSQIMRGPG